MNALKSAIKWIAAIAVICIVAVILANINGLSVSRTVATVGGVKVTDAEFKYYLELVKDEMIAENGNVEEEEFWKSEIDGKKATDIAKERALEEVIRTQIACNKANEAGVVLSDAEKAEARSLLNADTADAKAQLKELEKNLGADKYEIADIIEKVYLSNAYYQSIANQEESPLNAEKDEIAAKAEETYARVKHVLISSAPQTATDENGKEIDADAYAKDAKAKAEEVLAKAVAGENFEALITEYGEDPGMTSSPDGYIIDNNGVTVDSQSQMIPEFTKGTFAVKAGEVNSALVESSYGWHIIKRYALPTEGEEYATIMSSAQNSIMTEKYNEYLDSFKDSVEIVVKDNIIKSIKVK